MSASGGLNGNGHPTLRTFLFSVFNRRRALLVPKTIDGPDHDEYAKRDDGEVNNLIDEETVIQCHGLACSSGYF